MSQTLTYYMLDDEELSLMRLKSLIKELDSDTDVTLAGSQSDPVKAIGEIIDLQPDVLFLDIQMPKLDGFDVAEALGDQLPHVIFVTAFDEYAIKAFDIHALDYLTKPVRRERLEKSIRRLTDQLNLERQKSDVQRLLHNRDEKPTIKVIALERARKTKVKPVDEVCLFSADDKIVYAETGNQAYRVNFNLTELEDRLPDMFLRIHRSHIVNLSAIEEIYDWKKGQYQVLLKNGTTVDVSRRNRKALRERLNL